MHSQHLRPEAKTSAKLDAHVKLFFRTFNIEGVKNKGIFEFYIEVEKHHKC